MIWYYCNKSANHMLMCVPPNPHQYASHTQDKPTMFTFQGQKIILTWSTYRNNFHFYVNFFWPNQKHFQFLTNQCTTFTLDVSPPIKRIDIFKFYPFGFLAANLNFSLKNLFYFFGNGVLWYVSHFDRCIITLFFTPSD